MIELQYALFQKKLGLCPNSDLKNPNIYTALADLRYLKLGFLLDQLIWVWNTPFLKPGFRYWVLLQYSALFFRLRVYSHVPTWIISWWRRASCSISSWYVLFSPCPTRNTTFTFFIVFASSPQEPLEKEVYQLCCINCETEPWYT